MQSSLKYLGPTLIIPTVALQSVLKIIRLSYQASLRMAELHCFGKKCFYDLVKPLENIDSDRIVEILCDFKRKESSFYPQCIYARFEPLYRGI